MRGPTHPDLMYNILNLLGFVVDSGRFLIMKVSIKRFLKRNLAHVGMVQCMNALADKVHKQEVPCTQ